MVEGWGIDLSVTKVSVYIPIKYDNVQLKQSSGVGLSIPILPPWRCFDGKDKRNATQYGVVQRCFWSGLRNDSH